MLISGGDLRKLKSKLMEKEVLYKFRDKWFNEIAAYRINKSVTFWFPLIDQIKEAPSFNESLEQFDHRMEHGKYVHVN